MLSDNAESWKLISDEISGEQVKLWYAADVLSFLDNNHDYGVRKSMPCRRNLKRPQETVYGSREDNFNCNILASPKESSSYFNAAQSWSIHRINDETLLRHMNHTPFINSCMYHVGRAFTHFYFHIDVKNLSSISILCEGALKLWYVINASSKNFVAS